MLDIQHLSFAVTNEAAGKEILHDITLTVDSGRFVVITGPNGGGKSTLAKMIAGIEKPTAGKILLDGTDMTDLSITDRAKLGVSYAFQQPVRFKGITVLDLLRIASGKRLSVSEACAILSEVGLCARQAFGVSRVFRFEAGLRGRDLDYSSSLMTRSMSSWRECTSSFV